MTKSLFWLLFPRTTAVDRGVCERIARLCATLAADGTESCLFVDVVVIVALVLQIAGHGLSFRNGCSRRARVERRRVRFCDEFRRAPRQLRVRCKLVELCFGAACAALQTALCLFAGRVRKFVLLKSSPAQETSPRRRGHIGRDEGRRSRQGCPLGLSRGRSCVTPTAGSGCGRSGGGRSDWDSDCSARGRCGNGARHDLACKELRRGRLVHKRRRAKKTRILKEEAENCLHARLKGGSRLEREAEVAQ